MPVQKGEKRGKYKKHTDNLPESGHKGVYRSKNNRWQAQLSIYKIGSGSSKDITIHIGTFDTAEEAHKARIAYIDSLK